MSGSCRNVVRPLAHTIEELRSIVIQPAIRISVSSPDRSFCTRRISIRPCFQIENGMRRLVFSFRLAQPALLFDRAHYLARQVFRPLFQQTHCSGRLAIDDESLDTRQAPL